MQLQIILVFEQIKKLLLSLRNDFVIPIGNVQEIDQN